MISMSKFKLKHCPICDGSVSMALMGGTTLKWLSITRSGEPDSCNCRLFMQSDLLPEEPTCEDIERVAEELANRWNHRVPMERITEQLKSIGNQEVILHGGRANGKTLTLGYTKGIENALHIVNKVDNENS